MNANYHRYKRYDLEFKRSAVELLESTGRSIAEVAGDLGIPYKTLERWKSLYRRRPDKPLTGSSLDPVAAENTHLKRKLAYVERERDILKKALAICSREEGDKASSS